MQPVQEAGKIDAVQLRTEIMPAGVPVLLKQQVADWPAVQAGAHGAERFIDYLDGFGGERLVDTQVGDLADGGRLFYADDMRGFNFRAERGPLRDALRKMLQGGETRYIQSTPAPALAPGFDRDNALTVLDRPVEPRLWFGTRTRVPPHFDLSYNVACVVAGRRRFTLFPPDQLRNLYMGPVDLTPAGTPVSMVDPDAPDLDRYPRFAQAMATAQQAELEPGDAIYIPYGWWHGVEALAPFNALVNYWWNPFVGWEPNPYNALMHAALAFRDLPPDQRAFWRAMLDELVFGLEGEPLSHLSPDSRGAFRPFTAERARHIKHTIAAHLSK